MITGPSTIWQDPSLGQDFIGNYFNRYGADTKICIYKNSKLNWVINSPKIMYGSTLKDIKEIWVGNKKVYDMYKAESLGVPVHYMYYYQGSWHPAQTIDSISEAKSYLQYSGEMQYGVYIHNYTPLIYFNGVSLEFNSLQNYSSGIQYVYNGYIVAIANPENFNIICITRQYGSIENTYVNIPPYTVAFFNMGYVKDSLGYGSGSGSGSATSSLSNCYLTLDVGKGTVNVPLDFTGATNYQAT